MEKRILTITLQADWKATLRAAGKLRRKTVIRVKSSISSHPAHSFPAD